MKNKRIAVIIAFSALAVLLIGSIVANAFLVVKVYQEREMVKNAVVPPVADDYFTRGVIAAQYEAEMYREELEEIGDEAVVQREAVQRTDVETQSQLPDYPNGCEAACAVMLLRYYGVDISLSEFIEKYLPMQSVYENRGKRYAPDPSRFYAGDPASKTRGWGCFPPVIKKAMVTAFADKSGGWYDSEELDEVVMKKDDRVFQYYVVDCSGAELFRYDHLPMIIWVTQDYEPVSEVYEWQQFGGNKTFTYPKGSHTVLLTGYDKKYYYINDPLKAEKSVKVKKKKLEDCFMSVGCQAVSVFGNEVTDYLDLNAYLNADSDMQKYGERNKG